WALATKYTNHYTTHACGSIYKTLFKKLIGMVPAGIEPATFSV
ncbi:hypothetical protein LCGC14_3020840, partial [marine sediment metagenome]